MHDYSFFFFFFLSVSVQFGLAAKHGNRESILGPKNALAQYEYRSNKIVSDVNMIMKIEVVAHTNWDDTVKLARTHQHTGNNWKVKSGVKNVKIIK